MSYTDLISRHQTRSCVDMALALVRQQLAGITGITAYSLCFQILAACPDYILKRQLMFSSCLAYAYTVGGSASFRTGVTGALELGHPPKCHSSTLQLQPGCCIMFFMATSDRFCYGTHRTFMFTAVLGSREAAKRQVENRPNMGHRVAS